LGIVVAVITLGALPQFWLNSQIGGSLISPGYESQVFSSGFTTKLVQVWDNAQSYSDKIISNSLIPAFGPNIAALFDRLGLGVVPSVANYLILLAVVIGVILSLRCFKASDLYAGFYFMGILAFWNPNVGSAQARFLIPLVPFLYFYLIQAVVWLAHWLTKNRTRNGKDASLTVVVLMLMSPILLLSFARNIQDWQNPVRNRITDLSIGTTWISENTPQESIIMARDPVPDYLYARRRTIAYPSSGQNVEEYIKVNGIDYILVSPKLQTPRTNELDDFTETNLVPLLTSNPSKFWIVYTNTVHNVTVYEVSTDK
jgi:hypothetical protein